MRHEFHLLQFLLFGLPFLEFVALEFVVSLFVMGFFDVVGSFID